MKIDLNALRSKHPQAIEAVEEPLREAARKNELKRRTVKKREGKFPAHADTREDMIARRKLYLEAQWLTLITGKQHEVHHVTGTHESSRMIVLEITEHRGLHK